MSDTKYTLIHNGDEANITVFVPGDPKPLVAHSSHPNFQTIVTAAVGGEDVDFTDLFDTATAIAKRFESLSERVSVANGTIYLDGDPIHSAITKHILRFMDEGVNDWKPLVAFFEKVQDNPNEHSREQLYDWLDCHDFTISPIGNVIGYKGVESDGKGGYRSVSSGKAIVDGEVFEGKIPNKIGSVVEMPRTEVAHDPKASCSTGLHVATFGYAQSWARDGATLEVHVNPRDVVSVPTDASGEKVRVCRYIIARTVEAAHDSAFVDDASVKRVDPSTGQTVRIA